MTHNNSKIERLKIDPKYKDLSQVKDNNQVAKNIRIELKKTFPDVKFSIRKDRSGTIYISWVDGIIEHKVEKIVFKYRNGKFDPNEDMFIDKDDPFNEVFGGTEYIFLERKYSDNLIEKAIKKLKKQNKRLAKEDITVKKYNDGELWYMPAKEYLSSILIDSIHAEISRIASELEPNK